MPYQKGKKNRIGLKTKIFLSGLCFMTLFLVFGLNRVITTWENAILDLFIVIMMITLVQWVNLRKKRTNKF
jgi:hypothetical protein